MQTSTFWPGVVQSLKALDLTAAMIQAELLYCKFFAHLTISTMPGNLGASRNNISLD